MESARRLITYILLVFAAFLLNIPLFKGLHDGRPVDRLWSAMIYFGILAGLLTLATRSRRHSRTQAIIFLMLLSPCLLLSAEEVAIHPTRSFIVGYDLHISGWLGSTLYLLYGAVTSKGGKENELYRWLLPYQMYSILLNVGLTIILLRFRRYAGSRYNTPFNRLITGLTLIAGYLLLTHVTTGSINGYYYFLLVYVLLWGIYLLLRRRVPGSVHSLLVLALMLLFPTVSMLPTTINTITTDMEPSLTSAIGIVPMASAAPITLIKLVRDVSLQELPRWPLAAKLYTLLQAGIVWLALPAALAKERADYSA